MNKNNLPIDVFEIINDLNEYIRKSMSRRIKYRIN